MRFRIDPHLKAKAEQVFKRMGLTPSEALRLFINQSVAEKRIPFSINIPNPTTEAALEDAAHRRNLKKTSIKQLKKDWNEACDK